MKNILLIIISILTYSIHAQEIIELENEKSILINRISSIEQLLEFNSKEYDSTLASTETEIKNLQSKLIYETKVKDSINKLVSNYKISKENFEMYSLLKNENIIDPNSIGYKGLHKKIMKEYSISEEKKILIISNFFYLEKFDEYGRIFDLEKIILSTKLCEKQQKLFSKNSIQFLSDNNLLLENLTGVNQKYLQLIKQLEEIIHKIDSTNSTINKIEDVKIDLKTKYYQKIKILEEDYLQLSQSIKEIEKQITFISDQKRIETQVTLNYSKYKTKKVNGIDICTSPLYVSEFRNGDEIKKARTEGEWNQCIALKIPAYHFKDFDDNQGNFGLIYNYYAITDDREIAPHGFHKLNYLDFNNLENQIIFSETKLVDCYCGDGTEMKYESCKLCSHWTENQRKYNVCSKCQNKRHINLGKKKCSRCNGTKKIKTVSMDGREFCLFPSSNNHVGFQTYLKLINYNHENLLSEMRVSNGKCKLGSYSTESIGHYGEPSITYTQQGYQVLICKDRSLVYNDNFDFTKIGDIEMMNTYLNVTKFRNGDPIKYIEDPVEWELALKNKIPAYCYFNNVNDGKGCIYNIYAWNDKRGLIPVNWRSITEFDIVNIAHFLGFEISLTNHQSPLSPPPGVRNSNGTFETITTKKGNNKINEAYFYHLNFSILYEYSNSISEIKYLLNTVAPPPEVYHLVSGSRQIPESGYVLCVRDASNIIIKK